ncbi:MAG: hypothetical protein QNJ41_09200 [Xenococcaceae cyanobacterium MO_188.B32]|nr:hypothetical protein [Xenococcaceae cyanobacterium MO_188.B32]
MNDEDSQRSQLLTKIYNKIENFASAEIERETKQKKLYYHNLAHAHAVKRRANIIFQAIKPILINKIEPQELDRIKYLIDICAMTHDLVQEFSFALEDNRSRERPLGLSETASINKIINYIRQVNQELLQANCQQAVIFTEADIDNIKEAIQATICHYDYFNNFIYQPYLYQSEKQLSLIAQIIAWADLGTLGMEGIEIYLQEGILLFLEENPDIAKLFTEQKNNKSNQNLILAKLNKSEVYPNLKEKLLKSTRSMVKFARSRKANFEREIASLDEEAKDILRARVFIYLTDENIHKIESIVPTEDNVNLTELLEFFNFDRYI